MLKLKNISKVYTTGDFTQQALDDVSVNFRKNEFVSILGQSGSGKTTMLNIIGGLDQYTSGDLIINGKSTKDYKSKDWDQYRNQSIGFVFQSYNLIPHQSVLGNVELALTLAGVSKKERKERAEEALTKVGLKEHIHKKPNQLSGGQMQRVAIARALVNNPEILLADEPTGALDSDTSTQVMDLLKEIAKEKLVIMVTHNPELAEKYSNRIVKLLDGKIIDDTNPFDGQESEKELSHDKNDRVSMSFFTALGLSFNNLKTKKGRTLLTAFAGSIGIIGISLILSLSAGMQSFIEQTEEDTLSSYPISIESQAINLFTMDTQSAGAFSTNDETSKEGIHQGGFVGTNLQLSNITFSQNNLEKFKSFLESDQGSAITDNTTAIQYTYGLDLQLYDHQDDQLIQINPSSLTNQNSMPGADSFIPDLFTEIIDNQELLDNQYQVLAGHWPENQNDLVLVLNENNQISDMSMYALGLKDQDEFEEISEKVENGEEISSEDYSEVSFTYDEIIGKEYQLVRKADTYEKVDGIWVDRSQDREFMEDLVANGQTLTIAGIIKPSKDAVSATINGDVGYTSELSQTIIESTENSEIVQEQMNNPDVNILTGNEFVDVSNMTQEEFMEVLSEQELMQINQLPENQQVQYIQSLRQTYSQTYRDVLTSLGSVNYDNPDKINLYLESFESRDIIVDEISEYNLEKENAGEDDAIIEYTDLVGLMTSSISSIIDIITYLLIGFVSISLVVSSIMIGIITYISVLERTKEIGVLRSIGASKKDIARVFNAETAIIGFVSGALGILVTLLLLIPINMVIGNLSGVDSLAYLPPIAGLALVAISVILTLIAGLVPSKMASNKDPVIALRTE